MIGESILTQPLRAETPYFDGTIIASRNNLILSECQAAHSSFMANKCGSALSLLTRPDLHFRLILGVVNSRVQGLTNLDRSVVAAAYKAQLVGGDGPNPFDMSEICSDGFSRINIPKLDGVIQAP